MKPETTIAERRQRTRTGILATIEDITYNALRKYGVVGERAPSSTTPEATA